MNIPEELKYVKGLAPIINHSFNQLICILVKEYLFLNKDEIICDTYEVMLRGYILSIGGEQ